MWLAWSPLWANRMTPVAPHSGHTVVKHKLSKPLPVLSAFKLVSIRSVHRRKENIPRNTINKLGNWQIGTLVRMHYCNKNCTRVRRLTAGKPNWGRFVARTYCLFALSAKVIYFCVFCNYVIGQCYPYFFATLTKIRLRVGFYRRNLIQRPGCLTTNDSLLKLRHFIFFNYFI